MLKFKQNIQGVVRSYSYRSPLNPLKSKPKKRRDAPPSVLVGMTGLGLTAVGVLKNLQIFGVRVGQTFPRLSTVPRTVDSLPDVIGARKAFRVAAATLPPAFSTADPHFHRFILHRRRSESSSLQVLSDSKPKKRRKAPPSVLVRVTGLEPAASSTQN